MTIQIERVRDRIYLRSPSPTPGLNKDIPGANYSTFNGPHWSLPLSLETCHALRARFGQQLQIGPQLRAWAIAEKAKREHMTLLGGASDATLQRLPELYPGLAKAMASRTYQRVGARFIADGKAVLIADDPGLGKTLEALGGVVESGVPGPYLVVCPKTAVLATWEPEIHRWLPGQSVITVPDGRAKRDAILNGVANLARMNDEDAEHGKESLLSLQQTWVIIHPEMMRTKSFWVCEECGVMTPVWAGPKSLSCEHDPKQAPRNDFHDYPQLFAVDWGAIVVDESDKALIRATGTPTQTRNGAELLPLRDNGLRIAMSGTPMRGKPRLFWSTLNWLQPKRYGGFWRWAETYFEISTGYGSSREIGKLRADREEQLYADLNGIVLRRTKAEVAKDMPPKTYLGNGREHFLPAEVMWLPMSAKQAKAHAAMAANGSVDLEGGSLNAIGTLAELTRMKQFAVSYGRIVGGEFVASLPSNKLDYCLELLESMGYPDDPQTKVIIVSQFTSVLKVFSQQLSKLAKTCLLTGEVSGAKRAQMIKDFNVPAAPKADEPNLMLLQIKAGGVAITIDTADHMVTLDETWIPDDMIQVEDRIHRVSKPRPVFYHHLRSLGSVEEAIARVTAEREHATKTILDGRRGVDFSKQVVEVKR